MWLPDNRILRPSLLAQGGYHYRPPGDVYINRQNPLARYVANVYLFGEGYHSAGVYHSGRDLQIHPIPGSKNRHPLHIEPAVGLASANAPYSQWNGVVYPDYQSGGAFNTSIYKEAIGQNGFLDFGIFIVCQLHRTALTGTNRDINLVGAHQTNSSSDQSLFLNNTGAGYGEVQSWRTTTSGRYDPNIDSSPANLDETLYFWHSTRQSPQNHYVGMHRPYFGKSGFQISGESTDFPFGNVNSTELWYPGSNRIWLFQNWGSKNFAGLVHAVFLFDRYFPYYLMQQFALNPWQILGAL